MLHTIIIKNEFITQRVPKYNFNIGYADKLIRYTKKSDGS